MSQDPWADFRAGASQATSGGASAGGVFVPAPGAARQEARAEEGLDVQQAQLGLSGQTQARSGRQEVRGAAQELRDAFEKQKPVQDYLAALPAYSGILDLASKAPSKANDFSIITLFNKIQDPGSAVLEGERTAAQNASTFVEKYKTQLQGLFDPEAGFVSDEARRQFVQTAQSLITERNRAYNAMRDRYSAIAQAPEYGVNPDLVVGQHYGQTFVPELTAKWEKIFPQKAAPAAGGGDGPNVTATPEQSIAAFGELTYNDKGQLVGADYAGMGYDEQGNEKGLVGTVTDLTPADVQSTSAPSFFGGVADAITGGDRSTPTTERLPDWVNFPGLNDLMSSDAWKVGLGTAFGGSPQEIAQIVQSNIPGTTVWQDEKGNYILRAADGSDYAIKPGFQVSDIPRAGNIIGAGLIGGAGATSIAGTAGREALLQGGVETLQAGTGGTFNPSDIAIAGAGGAAGKYLEQALPGAVQAVRGRVAGPAATPVELAEEGASMASRMAPSPVAPVQAAPVAPAAAPIPAGTTVRSGDAGAARASEDTIRAERARELPVPIELAKFQRSRLFEEQQRARELAKNNEIGAPIRQRLSEQQTALRQNFDRFVDDTGSEVWENAREKGIVVDEALKKLASVGKTRVRTLYNRAVKAGETQEPVGYQQLAEFVGGQTPTTREQLAPVLKAVEEQLAKNDPSGTGAIPINALEDVRKLINKVAQPGTPNEAYGREMKGIIDGLTEGKGGDLYKAARQARIDYANTFENAGLVKQLMGTKPGTVDRQVALENVAEKAIYSGGTSLDDIRALKGVLDKAGTRGDRAWKELQGATIEHLRDAAYRGIAKDEAGNTVISPAALNKAISALDRNGKLDFVFGTKMAELLRTMNEVAQDMFTAPPGSVNFSNSSGAIMNAIDTLATFSISGAPVPAGRILSGFRQAVQNRGLRKEVKRLLD